MSSLDIVTLLMVVGCIFMYVSGREIDKGTRALRERNKRERERMEKIFTDGDHAHG